MMVYEDIFDIGHYQVKIFIYKYEERDYYEALVELMDYNTDDCYAEDINIDSSKDIDHAIDEAIEFAQEWVDELMIWKEENYDDAD